MPHNLQLVMRVGTPDHEYAPAIIRNIRLHVGCMFWQLAVLSANSVGVIQASEPPSKTKLLLFRRKPSHDLTPLSIQVTKCLISTINLGTESYSLHI